MISAAAVKCLGGQLLGRLWPRDDAERAAALDAGYDLERVLSSDDLVAGAGGATTESLVTRSRSGTIRRISATHDRAKLRAIAGGRY